MKQATVTQYFLGANSQWGFYSLYDQFCAGADDRLHIIKGGPGTGKSTFMRRIGKAAEARGYDVEYILCSGDPDSLDGVYIPALHAGWADGTAPHPLEPRYFGCSGDYEDLGRFCRTEMLAPVRKEIEAVTNEYRACYKKAYAYLGAAGILRTSGDMSVSPETESKICRRAQASIRKEITDCSGGGGVTKRFLRAISCQGNLTLGITLDTLCDRLCVVESHFGLEQLFFREIIKTVEVCGAGAILCPDPLCPDRVEAVIFPHCRLCLIAGHAAPDFHGKVRTVHPDAYLPSALKSDCRQREKEIGRLTELACFWLSQAKMLHDRLEAYYRPALDIDALDRYTQSVLDALN